LVVVVAALDCGAIMKEARTTQAAATTTAIARPWAGQRLNT
jgi:hypothetical protein